MPIGAHTVLGFLAEPLKQLAETLETSEDYNVFEDLREFQDWVCQTKLSYFNFWNVNPIISDLIVALNIYICPTFN